MQKGKDPTAVSIATAKTLLSADQKRRLAFAGGRTIQGIPIMVESAQNGEKTKLDDSAKADDPEKADGSKITKTETEYYTIGGMIGSGGQGTVHEVTRTLLDKDGKPRYNKKFAIKEIRIATQSAANSGMTDVQEKGRYERFIREVELIAKLDHDNIVKIIDFGERKGNAFYIMEFLDGQDLMDLISKSGPLKWEQTRQLMLQVCSALEAAHEYTEDELDGDGTKKVKRPIIHSDIKPENIFLIVDSEGRQRVKVLDFGLAKMHTTSERSEKKKEDVSGTPEHMAPEQARGEEADQRSDIYSLGTVIYKTLTGWAPFLFIVEKEEKDFPDKKAFHAYVQSELSVFFRKVFTEPARPPSLLSEGLPNGIDAIVLKCLEKDPKDRYQSVRELKEAIKACDGKAKADGDAQIREPEPGDIFDAADLLAAAEINVDEEGEGIAAKDSKPSNPSMGDSVSAVPALNGTVPDMGAVNIPDANEGNDATAVPEAKGILPSEPITSDIIGNGVGVSGAAPAVHLDEKTKRQISREMKLNKVIVRPSIVAMQAVPAEEPAITQQPAATESPTAIQRALDVGKLQGEPISRFEQTQLIRMPKAAENKTPISQPAVSTPSKRLKWLAIGAIALTTIGAGSAIIVSSRSKGADQYAVQTTDTGKMRGSSSATDILPPDAGFVDAKTGNDTKVADSVKEYSITVKTDPKEVQVLLWGDPVCTSDDQGACTFRIGETSDTVKLTFKKNGYADASQEFSLDSDRTVEVTLERQKGKPAGSAAKKPKGPGHKPSITSMD